MADSLEALVGHYIELSDTVSGDPEVGFEDGKKAWAIIAKAQADLLRSLADEMAGVGAEPWDRLTPAITLLRRRAERLEEGLD